jgi:hypothetical protein
LPGEIRVSGEPILRGAHDAPPLFGWQRPGVVVRGLAPLHLDEGETPALERHEVDLADGESCSAAPRCGGL